LSILLIKIGAGVQEVGTFGRGLLSLRYVYSIEELKEHLLDFCAIKPELLAYIEKKNLIAVLCQNSGGSLSILKEDLLKIEEQMKKEVSSTFRLWENFSLIWDWMLSHPQQSVLIGSAVLSAAGLIFTFWYDQTVVWGFLAKLGVSLEKVSEGTVQSLKDTHELAELTAVNSKELADLSFKVAKLSTLLNEYGTQWVKLNNLILELSPTLKFLAENKELLQELVDYSTPLCRFGHNMLFNAEGVTPFTESQKIDILSALATHLLQQNGATAVESSA